MNFDADLKNNAFQADFFREQEEPGCSLRWDEPGAEGEPSAGTVLAKGHHPIGAELGAGNGVRFTIFYYFVCASMAFSLICLFP